MDAVDLITRLSPGVNRNMKARVAGLSWALTVYQTAFLVLCVLLTHLSSYSNPHSTEEGTAARGVKYLAQAGLKIQEFWPPDTISTRKSYLPWLSILWTLFFLIWNLSDGLNLWMEIDSHIHGEINISEMNASFVLSLLRITLPVVL